MSAAESSSTRPYLIRALYEWCCDNGLTPYVAVSVDETVQVPREYVKKNEIVLNISADATSSLQLGNDFIAFKARFAGSAREILVPISHVIAIYARENGQGMAFPMLGAGPGRPLDARADGDTGHREGRDAPNPITALHGIADSSSDSKIMQLVPEISPEGHATHDDVPDPPRTPPRTRPSLKRVK